MDDLPAVTVLGLGEMGAALAGAFLAAGHPTTVWNRTRDKAEALVARGANQATDAVEAITASPIVVINVMGGEVAGSLLESAGDKLDGRTVVNLTDGPSARVRQLAAQATRHGAGYLRGQIMTIAPGIGQPEAVVFYGGPEELYERHESTLRALGGAPNYLSTDVGTPALYGMAVHAVIWGTLNGFLHAAAMLADANITAQQVVENAGSSMAGPPVILGAVSTEVDSGEFAADFGALIQHLTSREDLLQECRDRGVEQRFPTYTRNIVAEAIQQGHGGDSYSRLVERFRVFDVTHGQTGN